MLHTRSFVLRALLCLTLFAGRSAVAQVSLQTGSSLFSLPIFNWQDDKSRLYSQVGLSYNSGNGLKVNDVASDVGTGWSLVQGGVITRMQVGLPDDQQAYLGTKAQSGVENDADISKYPAGWLYEPVAPGAGCPNALTKYPIYKGMNVLYSNHNVTMEDRQQDYFAFQFNGKAGIFVIDTANGGEGRSLGDNKLIIRFKTSTSLLSQGIRTTIASFTIQDADGLIYTFNHPGKTTILHEDYCDAHQTAPMTQPTFKGGNVYYQAGFTNSQLVNTQAIGSWYLDSIQDPLTHHAISFSYINRTINNTAGADVTYNLTSNYSTVSSKTSITTTPVISSITFPDGHLVSFTYNGTPRVDLNGEYALSLVDVSYQGRAISEYQLTTSYFILNRYGTPSTSYEKSVARLCLRSVKKIGVDLKADTPPYIFDYYLGSGNPDDIVAPPFFYAKDIWGFYNGNNSVDASGHPVPLNTTVYQLNNSQLEGLCFYNASNPNQPVLNPKTGYAKNGLLKQVVYPTGGTLTWLYSQDSGRLNGATGQVVPVGGVHVYQTQSTDGGYSNGCANPMITQYNYVSAGSSSLWGLEMPVNKVSSGNSYASEDKVWHWSLSCVLSCCYWKYQYPGIMSQLQAVSLSEFQNIMNVLAPYLGVVSIITDIMDVATVIGGSTGILAIGAVIIDAIGALLSFGLTCFSGNNSRNTNYSIYYNTDLNGASPLPTQFNRVEIVEGSGTMGRTVHRYTDSSFYGLWVGGGQNRDFSNKQRFAAWAYGLSLYDSVFDANNNPVKQTAYTYDLSDVMNPITTGFFSKMGNTLRNDCSCKCTVNNTYSQNSADWTNPSMYNSVYLVNSNSDLIVDSYYVYTGRAQLQSLNEQTFSTVNPSLSTSKITTYTYDQNNYEVYVASTTRSDGSVLERITTYPDNYFSSGNPTIVALYNNNILNEPIDVEDYVVNKGVLQENTTIYTTLANGNIRPDTILEQRFTQPSNSAGSYYPGNNLSNYHVLQTFTYDANSNLTGVKDEGGRVATSIYDYNDKYVVASVVDADPVLDKPAYTSFETAGLGGWLLKGSPAYTGSAITGTRSMNLTGNNLTAPLNTAKEYIVSFWSTAQVGVSAGSVTKSAPTINGFTYYEYAIPAGNTYVSVSGSANIDELRLYPKMARMRTTTFDPLIGKTAECDENNRVTYYSYDELGRLQFIKDEFGSVKKMYEYNNISAAKQNGCPGTYHNKEVIELMTRNNCTAGFTGDTISYIVPANQFSSVFNQADADIQAEIFLLTNGQTYANQNAGCLQVFQSAGMSMQFSDGACPDGYAGQVYTYSVPMGRYTSTINQADADQKAKDEMNANGQAYANALPLATGCAIDHTPDWTLVTGGPTTCMFINDTSWTMEWTVDINPNSSTYNTNSWQKASISPTSCGVVYAKLFFENIWVDTYGETHGDVIVRFFSDAACTQPLSVSMLNVNYNVTWEFDNSVGTGSVTGNGTSAVIALNTPLDAPDPTCFGDIGLGQFCVLYNYDYDLLPGNYSIEY